MIRRLALLLTPKRRWFQFSLGTLFIAVTLFCVWLADRVDPVRRHERQLHDDSEALRMSAASKLGAMGSKGRAASASLAATFSDENESSELRCRAIWAFTRVGGDIERLAPLLTALGRIGPAARGAVPKLVAMTMSNDMALSAQACVVLAQIEPDGQQVVPCFRRFLAAVERDSPINPRTGVREVIFDAFWQLRSNAQPLAVDLRRMVLSSPMRTRRDRCHAAFALASFPDERAAALGYLESISAHEYGYGDGYLANEILAKIKEKLRQPVAVSSD